MSFDKKKNVEKINTFISVSNIDGLDCSQYLDGTEIFADGNYYVVIDGTPTFLAKRGIALDNLSDVFNVTVPTNPTNTNGTVKLDFDTIFKEMQKRFNIELIIQDYSCINCGASLVVRNNDAIVKCPYCRTAYAVGTQKIMSRY